MGTAIFLEISGVVVDYSKNHMGLDHGHLFQEQDHVVGRSAQYSYDDDDNDRGEPSLCRSLRRVVPRLNLLGHTLATAQREYEQLAMEWRPVVGAESPPFLSFDEFCQFACRRPLRELSHTTHPDSSRDDFDTRYAADEAYIERLPFNIDRTSWSEASYFASTCCVLSPYSMLQVFATLEGNLDAEVMWQYGPIVEAGWVDPEMIVTGARRRETTLIATEGTSDAHILKRALDLLQPEVADFFRFIDVAESHPFPGTGSLRKFAEGLVRIDVHNQVIILLDNDAEGVDALRRLQDLQMPPTMAATLLPDHPALKAIPARGPEGVVASNINGRAAAIECYLDLNRPGRPAAQVLWSNYKREVDAWQGALEHKEDYAERFLKAPKEALATYDMSKLQAVVDHLVSVAGNLAACAGQDV